jgi:hypothetical protein
VALAAHWKTRVGRTGDRAAWGNWMGNPAGLIRLILALIGLPVHLGNGRIRRGKGEGNRIRDGRAGPGASAPWEVDARG